MCHYPQDFRISYTDLAPSRLCPRMQDASRALTDPAFQSGNPRLRMGYVQSSDRRTTRARRQLPSKPFHGVAKQTVSRCGPVTRP
jgi:hypothetical protein